MKTVNSKKVLFAGTAIIVIAAALLSVLQIRENRKPAVIAFYNVSEKNQQVLTDTIEKICSSFEKPFRHTFATLDAEQPLQENLKKDRHITLVFTPAGANLDQIAATAVKQNPSIYEKMPASVKKLSDTYVPLLLDNFEAAYSTKILKQNSLEIVYTFDQMIKIAKTAHPENAGTISIFCAGKTDHVLGKTIAAFTEAQFGTSALQRLSAQLTELSLAGSKKILEDVIDYELIEGSENATLRTVLSTITKLKTDSLLHPEWQTMSEADFYYFMLYQNASVVFMPLSFHRTLPNTILRNYTECFFPEETASAAAKNQERSLVYEVTCGVVPKNRFKSKSRSCSAILGQLASQQIQEQLSLDTGLAPVHVAAETPDMQSNLARFWAAAADQLLPGLEQAFLTKAEQESFFEQLRLFIATGSIPDMHQKNQQN